MSNSTFKDILKIIVEHPLYIVIRNLFIIMVLYTLSRLLYFFANHDLYAMVTGGHLWEMLCGGMRFDMTAVFYLNSVYVVMQLLPLHFRENHVYQTVARWFYYIPNIVGLFCNSVDTIYTRFSAKRTTLQFFTEFANDNNLFNIFCQAVVQYWYVSLITLVFFTIVIICYKPIRYTYTFLQPVWYYTSQTILLCVCAYLYVIGIRGFWGGYTRPLSTVFAAQYANNPQETNVVLNTPFTLLMSTEMHERYKSPQYYPTEELEVHMSPIHHGTGDSTSLRKKNVVIFILESFAKEYSGFFNKDLNDSTYKGYTPFMDSIYQQSVTFKYSFASGRKSIDAMPSILSSLPMLYSNFFVSVYSTNAISSIADCLNKYGYNTSFFHGGPNGSMGFQAYAHSCGFQKYYGMDEYGSRDAYDGSWAIWDEEFLQYYAKSLGQLPRPFCSSIFTASSHHPFRVPARYEGVFPKGDRPIHQCVGYSDHALRRFFEAIRETEWYKNTLFVFTADHTNQLTHPEYLNDKGLYEVPIAFFSPEGDLTPELRDEVISQTDIMPSILGYLGYPNDYFAFGEDALTYPMKNHPYAICYNAPMFQIFSNHLIILFDGTNVTNIYDFKKDRLLQHDIKDTLLDTQEVQDMLGYLKAYLQQYVDRMNADALTIKE